MTQESFPGIAKPPVFYFRDAAVSQTRLNKIAKQLRNASDPLSGHVENLLAERELVNEYRRGFQTPMLKVRMGLTSFTNTLGAEDARLTQRLKRFDRIMLKLRREATMPLAKMQDIGGCRLIVRDLEEQRNVFTHLQRVWKDEVAQTYDYVTHPRESGYRAVHVVVLKDGRLIECQIRTENQHLWADYVERLGRDTGVELKWGNIELDLQQELQQFSQVLADDDQLAVQFRSDGVLPFAIEGDQTK